MVSGVPLMVRAAYACTTSVTAGCASLVLWVISWRLSLRLSSFSHEDASLWLLEWLLDQTELAGLLHVLSLLVQVPEEEQVPEEVHVPEDAQVESHMLSGRLTLSGVLLEASLSGSGISGVRTR